MLTGNQELIRDINTQSVLRTIITHGAISRASIASELGLTKATVSAIVQVLLDRGIGGIGSELGHLLATAHQRHARVERLDGDVAAVHALVELEIHGKSPFVV